MSTSTTTVSSHWPKPNYVNAPSRAGGAIAYNTILIVVVVIVVSLRYYSRVGILKQRLGWDDFFIGLSLICTLALSSADIVANAKYGYSRHVWDILPAWYPGAIACGFVIKLSFILAATFTRISMLCFYSRMVVNSGVRWFRHALIASHVFVAALGIAFFLPMIFACRPVSAAFDVTKKASAVCINEGVLFYVGGIINTIADALVTVLPIPLIMRLKMPKHERIGVVVLLSLGFFVTIAGIVRTYYIWLAQVHTQDETWWSYPLFVAASVEVDVGIVCACIPTLRPLFAPYFKSISTTLTSGIHSHNDTHRGGSRGGSRVSTHFVNDYSRKTPSPSKQRFLTTQHSLHSLTASGASTLQRATPDPAFRPREDDKHENFDLDILSQARSRASMSQSDTSGASTLVPSSAVSPTGSIYIPRKAGNAFGKDSRNLNRDEITVIKEAQVELGSTDLNNSSSPKQNIEVHRARSPFRPFTAPISPPQRYDSINSTPNDSREDDWTRLPGVEHHISCSQSQEAASFSPYYPNLSHAQVAAAAGYKTDLEQGVARITPCSPSDRSTAIGIAKTSSLEDMCDDKEDVTSDRKYMSGSGRARDHELVDIMQMFKEERGSRVETMQIVKGRAKIVNTP